MKVHQLIEWLLQYNSYADVEGDIRVHVAGVAAPNGLLMAAPAAPEARQTSLPLDTNQKDPRWWQQSQ